MSRFDSSVARFYEPWQTYNERIVEVVRELSPEELAMRPAPDGWPIWATVGHTAGGRVYWLCGVFGEPGAEKTPFSDPASGIGWEDDLDTPRAAAELVEALESSWLIIDRCLGSGHLTCSSSNTSPRRTRRLRSILVRRS